MMNYLVLALAGASMVVAAPANMTESYAMKMGVVHSNMQDTNANATKRDLGNMGAMNMNTTNIASRQLTGLNTTGTADDATETLGMF